MKKKKKKFITAFSDCLCMLCMKLAEKFYERKIVDTVVFGITYGLIHDVEV